MKMIRSLTLALLLACAAPIVCRAAVVVGENAGPMHVGASGIDAAVTGDTAIAVPYAQYVVRRVTVYGASADLTATTATVGLYTASGGGGANLIAATPLTGLTASTVVVDLTTPAVAAIRTEATLYLRVVQGVAPAAGTIKAVLDIQPLP